MSTRTAPKPSQVQLICLACFATFTGAEADERPIPGARASMWHCPKCGSDHLDYLSRNYRRPDEGLH